MRNRCGKCRVEKDESEFTRDRTRKSGLDKLCRACKRAKALRHPGYQREYARRPEVAERKRAERAALKDEVLSVYGGICACCGETEFNFLTIDHVGGGGNKHRLKLFGKKSGASTLFYRWLRQSGFPPGYRVLCFNCNIAIGIFGSCPHENAMKLLKFGGQNG